MILATIDSTLQISFLYTIPALAVLLSCRVVGFPDLTPDGSFAFGASLSGALLLAGWPTSYAMLLGFIFGAIAGIVTALIHTRLGVSKLLSGILVMLMLYSISLRVMGTSNISLMNTPTFLGSLLGRNDLTPIIITAILCISTCCLIWALLCTQIGLQLRATGDSPTVLEHRGIRREPLYILGLAISNGMVSLAGSVVSQYQGFVDVSMGTGLVIVCLAAIVMGETIIKPQNSLFLVLSALIGMLFYQSMIAIALRLGLMAADLKIATAMLAIFFIALDRLRTQRGLTERQIGNHNI
jgi:putative ABC transport system permease protein